MQQKCPKLGGFPNIPLDGGLCPLSQPPKAAMSPLNGAGINYPRDPLKKQSLFCKKSHFLR